MAIHTFTATSNLEGGLLVKNTARQHTVFVDEPESLGGTDTAVNPVELLLAALGSCQSIVARTYAETFGIDLKKFKVELAGDIDIDGFLNKSNVRPGFSDIRSTYYIETDADETKLKEFVAFLEAHCPVGDTLENGVNFSSTFHLNN